MRRYLDPTAPIAPVAILTDDPKLAMDLAVELSDSPRMSNLAHGLWGYHGTTKAGSELTIQATGIGGPSAFAVVSDLIRLGVEQVVRIGFCIALRDSLSLGSLAVAEAVEPADGVGRALADGPKLASHQGLTDALMRSEASLAPVLVRSVDLLPERPEPRAEAGVVDLSSGAVAAAAGAAGVAWTSALVVAETAAGERLGREALDDSLLGLGRVAAGALAAVAQASEP